MRREWKGRFPRHKLQMKPLVSDPGMHHGTWDGGENIPDIPGACASRKFTCLVRGPYQYISKDLRRRRKRTTKYIV